MARKKILSCKIRCSSNIKRKGKRRPTYFDANLLTVQSTILINTKNL